MQYLTTPLKFEVWWTLRQYMEANDLWVLYLLGFTNEAGYAKIWKVRYLALYAKLWNMITK